MVFPSLYATLITVFVRVQAQTDQNYFLFLFSSRCLPFPTCTRMLALLTDIPICRFQHHRQVLSIIIVSEFFVQEQIVQSVLQLGLGLRCAHQIFRLFFGGQFDVKRTATIWTAGQNELTNEVTERILQTVLMESVLKWGQEQAI